MSIKRAEIDPTQPVSRKGVSKTPSRHDWHGIADAAIQLKGEWAEYNGFTNWEPSHSPIRTYVARINKGELYSLAEHGRFEAIARGRYLYVRYLGPNE